MKYEVESMLVTKIQSQVASLHDCLEILVTNRFAQQGLQCEKGLWETLGSIDLKPSVRL